jgi:hypothetical protein
MYFPPMFRSLYNFGYQRRGLEVAAFYIAYLLGTIIAGAIVGSVMASLFGGDAFRNKYKVDMVTASIVLLIITYYSIKQKNLNRNILMNFLPLATAILSQFATPAIALIIPTFLSTLPGKTQFTPPPTSSNDGANENSYQSTNNPPQPNNPPPPSEQKLSN